jgi:hypothetical protein
VRLNPTSAKRSTKAINAAIGEPDNYEARHTFEVAFMLVDYRVAIGRTRISREN